MVSTSTFLNSPSLFWYDVIALAVGLGICFAGIALLFVKINFKEYFVETGEKEKSQERVNFVEF